MFLRRLSIEQKRLFLSLADKAAEANGIVDTSEQQLLEAYADEMDIPITLIESLSVQEISQELKKISTKKQLNQMAFELAALLLSDGEYDRSEQGFMSVIATTFGISKDLLTKMFDLVSEYSQLIGRIDQAMTL